MEPQLDIRGVDVVRGPDWKWGNQDGGEGSWGTVTDILKRKGKCVSVTWRNGLVHNYRIGRHNAFDLRVLDNAKCGVKHLDTKCNECHIQPVLGILWKCSQCFDYNLCSQCYHGDKHDITHAFWRYDQATHNRFKVPKRSRSRKLTCKSRQTKPMSEQDWTRSCQNDSFSNNEELMGNLTLSDPRETSFAGYYPEHLPILGKSETSPCEFHIGDTVTSSLDISKVMSLQRNHGGWCPGMEKYVHLMGRVSYIDAVDTVTVEYTDGSKCCYNQDVLIKADSISRASSTSKDSKATSTSKDSRALSSSNDSRATSSPVVKDIVRKVVKLGFEKDLVHRAVKKRILEGPLLFTDTESLINEVLDLQQERNANVRRDNSESPYRRKANTRTDTVEERSHQGKIVRSDYLKLQNSVIDDKKKATADERKQKDCSTLVDTKKPESDPQILLSQMQKLDAELKILRDEQTCKVCLDKKSCMTFVPCGHLVCCEVCCLRLYFCPVCRERIKKTVKTYMS